MRNYPDYPAPRGNVLLFSCMDLRLLDDIVRFMEHNNLTNRYDQFILAGTSLGAAINSDWKKTFFDHLKTAIELHGVEDLYILHHRNCGAYKKFLHEKGEFDDTPHAQEQEKELHAEHAHAFAAEIREWVKTAKARDEGTANQSKPVVGGGQPEGNKTKSSPPPQKEIKLQVYCFLMDLRGNVAYLP